LRHSGAGHCLDACEERTNPRQRRLRAAPKRVSINTFLTLTLAH
jgi:hypothetical protein